jgi:hypothetical protein
VSAGREEKHDGVDYGIISTKLVLVFIYRIPAALSSNTYFGRRVPHPYLKRCPLSLQDKNFHWLSEDEKAPLYEGFLFMESKI